MSVIFNVGHISTQKVSQALKGSVAETSRYRRRMVVPSIVLLMRHAEKPDDPNDRNLSAKGFARAEALAQYIPREFGTPDFIYAASISKNSARPYETVQPIAKRIGLPIDATIADQDYEALYQEVISNEACQGKKILICWHHGHLPELIRAFGAPKGSYPNPWDPSVFNLIVKLAFSDGALTATSNIEPF